MHALAEHRARLSVDTENIAGKKVVDSLVSLRKRLHDDDFSIE